MILQSEATPGNPLDRKIDRYADALSKVACERLTMRDALARIRTGVDAQAVLRCRAIRESQGKDAYRAAKKSLTAFTFAGTFERRKADAITQHSGVVILDFDHLDNLTECRDRVQRDPSTVFCFVSPGGDGLKVGLRCPEVEHDNEHGDYWRAAADYAKRTWGLEADKSGKDASRLCFTSADADTFVNESATVLDVPTPDFVEPADFGGDELGILSEYPPELQADKRTIELDTPSDRDKALAALARLSAARVNDYDSWLRVGMACKAVSHDLLPEWERLSLSSPKFKPGECAEKWESFKRNGVGLGSLIHWANEDDPQGRPKRKGKQRAEGDTRPEVRVRDDDLAVLVDEAWGALRAYNNAEPRIFRFGNLVTDITRDARNDLTIRPLARDAMRETLARAAFWFKLRKESDAESGEATFTKAPTKAPGELAALMCATPSTKLPVLQRIVRAPMVTASGRIHNAPGYDPDSRCWFSIEGLALPAVSSNPTPDELRAAREMFTVELLGDFPFCADGDRANCLAMLLLPFVREIIDGPTPLHLIEKPLPGSGASLLAEALALISRGTGAGFMTEGSDDDEWRKRITAVLLKGPELVVIDNVSRELASGALSSALTAHVWEDRLLGASEMLTLPIRCVWLATGNNPTTSSEIARRVVPIRIDPKTDRPTERADFRHPKLLSWVRENRAALVHAALTLASAWLAAGKPEGKANLASYERWAGVMGGLLDVAGVPGFLSNRVVFQSRADVVGEQTRTFISTWARCHFDKKVTASDLAMYAEDFDFGNCTNNGWRIRFGKFLRGLLGRVFTFDGVGLTVEAVGTMNGVSAYRLVQGSAGSAGSFSHE